jgi:hypothetical protein
MTVQQSKEELLSGLWEEFQRWERMLARLSEDQIVSRELPAGLSIKDVVGHLHAWQELSVARLEAALRGTEPIFELGPAGLDPDLEANLERINAWIHAKYLGRPWQKVHRDWQMNFLRFLDLAEVIPESDLREAGKYDWLKGGALADVVWGAYDHHHEEHYGPLSAWLREKGWLGEH